jgi:hypothetical protein
MKNYELRSAANMLQLRWTTSFEKEATDILQELVTRELQRMNPRSEVDPCLCSRPDGFCKFGTPGCSSPHTWEPTLSPSTEPKP